jgi:hypothetical protein
MAETSERSGVIIADAQGNVYDIPDEELEKFLVPKEKVEEVIAEAEKAGFELMEPAGMEPPVQRLPAPGSVINIFVGAATEPLGGVDEVPGFPGSTMAKYAGGSTMAKYAGGSTMAKYAGGSTMAKYAGGSTMAKYAGGSTMAKYAGGSTMAKYAGGSTMTSTRYGKKREQ